MQNHGQESATERTTWEVGQCVFNTILQSEVKIQALMWTIVSLTIVAITINVCVLLGLRHSEDFSWTPRFTLLKNLILSDIIIIITQGPTVTYCLYQRITLPLGIWCFIQYYMNTVCIFCSLLTITCMALERYIYVCQAIHYISILTSQRMWVVVCLTWLLSMCIAAVYISVLYQGREQNISMEGHTTFGLLCEPDTLETSMGSPRAAAIFRKLAGLTVMTVCLLSYSFSYLRMYQDARNAVQPFHQVNRRARNTVLFYCGMLLFQLLPVFIKIISDIMWEMEGTVAMVNNTCPVLIPSSTAGVFHVVLLVFLLVPPCVNPIVYGLRNHEVWQMLRRKFWCRGKCHEPQCMGRKQNPPTNAEGSA